MQDRSSDYVIRIQSEPIDLREAEEHLRTEKAGGVDIFLGTTRRWTDGRETEYLEYECYRSMAIAEMRRLIEEAAERWPIARACLIHRDGEVPLSEVSVLIGVATAHRAEAFEACRFLIDELKRRVPIWKRERFADGSSEWVEGSLPPITREESAR